MRVLKDTGNLEAAGSGKRSQKQREKVCSVNHRVKFGTGCRGCNVLGKAISAEWWWPRKWRKEEVEIALVLSLKKFRWGGKTKQAWPEVDIELGMVIVLWVLSFKGR